MHFDLYLYFNLFIFSHWSTLLPKCEKKLNIFLTNWIMSKKKVGRGFRHLSMFLNIQISNNLSRKKWFLHIRRVSKTISVKKLNWDWHSIPNDFGKHLAANNIISEEWGTLKPGFQVLEVPWRNGYKLNKAGFSSIFAIFMPCLKNYQIW